MLEKSSGLMTISTPSKVSGSWTLRLTSPVVMLILDDCMMADDDVEGGTCDG